MIHVIANDCYIYKQSITKNFEKLLTIHEKKLTIKYLTIENKFQN